MTEPSDVENWKLLTVTRGGTVSLINGLTEAKAKELAKTLHCNKVISGPDYPESGEIIRTEAFE